MKAEITLKGGVSHALFTLEDKDGQLLSVCKDKAKDSPYISVIDDTVKVLRADFKNEFNDLQPTLLLAKALQDIGCEIVLVKGKKKNKIAVWYSKQLCCFEGGYFYTLKE